MENLNEWFTDHEALMSFISTFLLGIIAVAITWIYSSKSKKISEDEIFYSLYSKFNERYDEINDDLEELFKGKDEIKTVEELKASRFHKIVIDFFNICAEEHYWNSKKRIEKEVWEAWSYGMNDWYNKIEVLKLLWKEEIAGENYKSYYLKKGDNLFIEK